MSNNAQNSLLDFLKKKSLFAQSPTKSNLRSKNSKSKSRDTKLLEQRSEEKNISEAELV